MASPFHSIAWWQGAAVLAIAAIVHYTISYFQSGLRKVPGPLSAGVSNLHRMWHCLCGNQMLQHLDLHRRYGPVVRIGPTCVSISDGQHIPLLYTTSGGFPKSDFYQPFDAAPGMPTIFSVQDESKHKTMSRQLGTAYSITSIRDLEPLNDACTSILLEKLQKKADAVEIVDIGHWFHWYASDVITAITFSNRLGFMEHEHDVDGLNQAIYHRMQYLSVVAQMSGLHRLVLGNPLIAPLVAKFDRTGKILAFAMEQMGRFKDGKENSKRDLLDRLKDRGIEDTDVLVHAVTNIFAGADTTGITLTALFYHILRNNRVYTALQKEITDANGNLSHPMTFTEAQSLPYLQAVIKETLRIHPAVGMLLERQVPTAGMTADGMYLPEGTTVGVNPWVVARDANVYSNPDEFRPERWLEADTDHLKLMERNFLAFGAGSRTCTGKAISLVEISKVVPELLRRFDFELVDPEKEWKMHDYFFVWQSGVHCHVSKRMR